MKSILFYPIEKASLATAGQIFYILLIVCLMTHIIRSIYEILKHKQTLKPGRLSFVIVFTDMILLWVSWILLCRFDIFTLNLPAGLRYTGLVLTVTGLVFFLAGLITIKTLESYDGDLIRTGIYSKIRHPMYTGFMLWLIGFPLFFSAGSCLGLSVLFIANILFWRHLEEEELEKRFPAYIEYRKTTLF